MRQLGWVFLGRITKIRNTKVAVVLVVFLLNSRNFRGSNVGRETHFYRGHLWLPIIPMKQIVRKIYKIFYIALSRFFFFFQDLEVLPLSFSELALSYLIVFVLFV